MSECRLSEVWMQRQTLQAWCRCPSHTFQEVVEVVKVRSYSDQRYAIFAESVWKKQQKWEYLQDYLLQQHCIHSRTKCFSASRWLLTTLIDHKIVWNLIQLIQRANRNNVAWFFLTYCPRAFSASHSRGLFFWFMLALKLTLSSLCHLLLHVCAWSSWALLKNGSRFM